METRAHHLLVGSFVIIVVLGLFGFVIWLAKIDIDREFARYTIYFEGSVSGLSTASSVLYNGIPVGTVTAIELDVDNPSRVEVTIEVAATTPVRAGSVATLELQGITGVSLVALTGGSPGGAELAARPGERYPVIDSVPSQFQRLFAGAPELISRSIQLIEQATKLFSEENLTSLMAILGDAETLSSELAARSGEVGSILDNIERTSTDVRTATVALNELMASLNVEVAAISDDTKATLSTVRGTLAGVDSLVDGEVRGLVAELSGDGAVGDAGVRRDQWNRRRCPPADCRFFRRGSLRDVRSHHRYAPAHGEPVAAHGEARIRPSAILVRRRATGIRNTVSAHLISWCHGPGLPGRRFIVVAALALSLSACAGLIPGTGPAPDLYTLSPKSSFDAGLPSVSWQLVVEEPGAAGGLSTQKIALRANALELQYFAGARWTERAPRLVQTLMVESFENTDRIVAVGRQAIGLRSDFNLKSELREFQAEYGAEGARPCASMSRSSNSRGARSSPRRTRPKPAEPVCNHRPQKSHERQAVTDLMLNLVVREICRARTE